MPKKKSKKSKNKILFFLILITISTLVFIVFDTQLTNVINKMTSIYVKDYINKAINFELVKLTDDENISSKDFYTITYDKNNEIRAIELNTLLINKICGKISNNISTDLNNNEEKELLIPFSTFLDIPYFYGYGPNIPIDIYPIGNVDVNYFSNFNEAGINQSSLEIWIEVKAQIEVMNPITQNEIEISRRVPIVGTIINGTVPEGFIYK